METMKEIVSSSLTSEDVIKPLELGKYNLSGLKLTCLIILCFSVESKFKDRRKVSDDEEEKSLSDELVDFMEEVTEEFLDTVIPEDD